MKINGDGYYLCDWCGLPITEHEAIPPKDKTEQLFDTICAIKCDDCVQADKESPLSLDDAGRDIKTKMFANMKEVLNPANELLDSALSCETKNRD